MASLKRDQLVDTALELFTKQGYRATGIDQILAESKIAKMTLYNHFHSKDELIIAALAKRDELFMAWIRDAISHHLAEQNCQPKLAKIMAFFDSLDDWFNSDGFYGCNFINACVEFKRNDDPIHAAATAHKKLVTQMLQELLAELQLANTHHVAKQIQMLVEGAIVMAVCMNDRSTAKMAKESALAVLSIY